MMFYAILIVALCCLANLISSDLRDLMMMQQNSYRPERFRAWLSQSGDSTSYSRLIAMAAGLLALATFSTMSIGLAAMGTFAAINATRLMCAKYKKPLVMTARARRILTADIILTVVITGVLWLCMIPNGYGTALYGICVVLTAVFCLSAWITEISVRILAPIEHRINRRYYNQAADILRSMPGLRIIGITGSYGKTTTKHYLQRILSERYETLMTPGSFNTTLGVVRTVRELMKPYTEVFIVEMGAKQPGDIKEICELVHPQAAILTAVGEQHLESFGTVENVRRTKFELIDALPANAPAVVNQDFYAIAATPISDHKAIRYTTDEAAGANVYARDITYTPQGTTFTYVDSTHSLQLSTPVVGQCNISNLTAAIAMALQLEVDEASIARAVARMPQVEHRLQITHTPGGITVIDDAFNSNPVGAGMALDVLSQMNGGRRIIVTPGMIELGQRQYDANREFGRNIAHSADIAFIVGQYNRKAILEGINDESNNSLELHTPDTFAQARSLLSSILRPGDTVLYENDLPDTFK